MSFLEHLEILRWHIIRSFFAVLITGLIAFLAKDFIFEFIIFGPKKPDFPTYRFFCEISEILCIKELPYRVQSRTVSGQFSAHIWTSITAGFILSFPYVLFELWRFIKPGLHDYEKKNARGFIFVASFLFFIGVLFGYYVVTPLSVNFLSNYTISKEVFNDFDLNSYIGLLSLRFVLWFYFRTTYFNFFPNSNRSCNPKFPPEKQKICHCYCFKYFCNNYTSRYYKSNNSYYSSINFIRNKYFNF